MQNKKIYYSILAFLLLILIVSTTYAFFAPQAGGTTSTNATVTSNTTDLLTFSINRDISFTVTQNDFQENGTNQSGDATATATLTPNNKTGAATMNYYLYLNIESNPIEYSSTNTNGLPELMLQVFDGGNQLVTLSDLGSQVTVKGVTGYDITALEGPITLLDNHAISASNNTATIENWRIVITLINHDFNQNDNTGKEVSAEIIIQQEELSLGFTGTIYRNNDNRVMNGKSMLAISDKSVYCAYDSLEDENTCDDILYWDTSSECESYLQDMGMSGYVCQQETRSFPGVGTYETNVNIIQANYNFYLKHEVVNDIIQNSEVCLYYNNEEFCFGTDYWIETGNGDSSHWSQENGDATKYKLQTSIEPILGAADSCNNGTWQAWCQYDIFSCITNADGGVGCRDNRRSCSASSNGFSSCIDK